MDTVFEDIVMALGSSSKPRTCLTDGQDGPSRVCWLQKCKDISEISHPKEGHLCLNSLGY
jgi:hypothetical protein